MKKGKDKSILQKITQAIIMVALCSSIIIGLVGAISLAVINSQSQQIYNDDLVPLIPLYKTQADFQTIRSNLKSMALEAATGTSSGTDYVSTIKNLEDDMSSQLNSYVNHISSDDEKNNYNTISSDFEKYKEVVTDVESGIKANQVTQAIAIMDKNNTISDELKNKISNAFTLNSNQAQQRNQTSTVIFIIAISAVVLFAAAFVLIAVNRGKRIAHNISDPINKMVLAANSIANGELNVDVTCDTGDETGILADAFKKIISSLKLLKTDVNMLVGEALEGRLDTRADLSRHNGDYREIIEGVNKTLDTVKTPLDVASEFVNKLADGIHQEDINNTYKGYYAVLIENLNKVRNSLSILVGEAAKLAEAGRNGELETRGDETKLKGVYSQIIHGVNETFDAIKTPLDLASAFISNLADGKSQLDIENNYKGYYAKLIDNLNNVRQSLRFLVDESSKLAQAGIRGDLAVRGDVGLLKGAFATIIDGFNNTLDAIIKPLNESGIILGKMSLNDYSIQMSDGYQGMLKDFAESINNVRQRLLAIETIVSEVGVGDLKQLDTVKKIGKRSENDRIAPSIAAMLQSIQDLIDEANLMATAAFEGNLSVRGDERKFEGGYRQIIQGMNKTMEAVSAPIEESSQVLQKVAQGDLRIEMTGEYKGEYNVIKTSLNEAVDSFNELLGEINSSAAQVLAGSSQVSDASQSLSQGAAEQASSVEELTSSIAEIAAQTKENAVNATQASEISTNTKTEAAQGNGKMDQMLQSMHEINESSTNISKIIKVIDDIAFQTNILALNAAVEAARAGQYGKGFAVVAEEVRNLAGKSAQAAKETTALIEGSIRKVEAGTQIANETSEMLGKIVKSAQSSAALVSNIATASNEQATAIAQIDQGVSQVSTVVQTNSATAEESAASSEELSGQANMLMKMVEKFKLKNTSSDKFGSTDESPREIIDHNKQTTRVKSAGKSSISLGEKFGKY
jgi:methyl-accepting chemotaxis protein